MCQDSISRLIDELLIDLKSQESSEGEYNILTVLGVDNKEVRICRLIGDLLGPNGKHNLGYTPLKLFLEQLKPNVQFNDDVIKDASIVLEDVIDNNRRVDIVIYMSGNVIPIEVKIWAGDQETQLIDYYNYYCERFGSECTKIYYLTPTGNKPSENSCGNLKCGEDYEVISFGETIKKWLDNILKQDVKEIRVKSLIEQFIEVIKKMCNDAEITKIVSEKFDFDTDDGKMNFNALCSLFNNSENILKMLKQKYAEKYIKCSKEYEYSDNKEEPKSYKNQVVFNINKTDNANIKIWLGYDDDGFYIMTEGKNDFVKELESDEAKKWKVEKACCWQRLKYRNYNVKLDTYVQDGIDISKILAEIK